MHCRNPRVGGGFAAAIEADEGGREGEARTLYQACGQMQAQERLSPVN